MAKPPEQVLIIEPRNELRFRGRLICPSYPIFFLFIFFSHRCQWRVSLQEYNWQINGLGVVCVWEHCDIDTNTPPSVNCHGGRLFVIKHICQRFFLFLFFVFLHSFCVNFFFVHWNVDWWMASVGLVGKNTTLLDARAFCVFLCMPLSRWAKSLLYLQSYTFPIVRVT